MRRQVPLILCFAFGIVMALTEFSPHPFSQGLNKEVIDWALVIGPFALVLAVATLVQTHWVRIRRRSEYWQYSFLVFIGMIMLWLRLAFRLVKGIRLLCGCLKTCKCQWMQRCFHFSLFYRLCCLSCFSGPHP